MRVIVCGGGIGGLTLAQALRDHCEVTVIERDPEAIQTGGYRLAINGHAAAVLARHLDSGLVSRIRAASDSAARFAQFTIANDRLRPIVIAREDAREDRLLAQRRALRLLLTQGLESSIRWASRVRRVEQLAGSAAVHLDTGERLDADLVVGAEGANSPTVRAVTAEDLSTDLRLTGIAGPAPRRPGSVIPRFLRGGPALAFAGDGAGMFLSLTSTGTGPLSEVVQEAIGPASLVWGLIAPTRRVGDTVATTPSELIDVALGLTRRWHPWMRRQIEATLSDRIAASRSGRRIQRRTSRLGGRGTSPHWGTPSTPCHRREARRRRPPSATRGSSQPRCGVTFGVRSPSTTPSLATTGG